MSFFASTTAATCLLCLLSKLPATCCWKISNKLPAALRPRTKALKGTCDFHCIRPIGAGLDVRALSCFCSVCLVNEEGVCENEEFVLGWSLMNVKEGPVELDVDVDDASECSQDSLEGEDVLINLQSLSKCHVDFFC